VSGDLSYFILVCPQQWFTIKSEASTQALMRPVKSNNALNMLFGRVTQSLGWSLLHLAGCTTAGSELVVRARNAPGTTDADTFRAIRRAISDIRLIGRDNVFTASEKISKSWDGAVLYSYTKCVRNYFDSHNKCWSGG